MAKKKIIRTAIGFGSMIIGCFLIYTLFTSVSSVYQRQNDLSKLEKQRETLKKEKSSLQNEIQLLGDDDYVVRYARENYVFTRDGEQVSIIPDSSK